MSTPVKNFAKATVSGLYSSSDLVITLSTGHGSKLSNTFPFPVVWWDSFYSDPSDDPNKEICTVGSIAGDVVTLSARGVEGTTATAKNTAGRTYKMLQCPTAAMWQELEDRSLSQSFRALEVRTHPDSDKALSQVMLVHADAIVMDDGQELSGWDRLVASLTVSGAGGIDSGTETNNAWYKVWAIYNRGTSAKAIMLQKAKDYTLDEDISAGEDGAHALRDATARTKLAQGFQVDNAGPCECIDVKIHKTGTPTGNFWFTLESNSGGVPSGTALATSDKYDVSRLPTGQVWFRIMFRNPASLSALTQYHIVLQGDFTVSATNYMQWRADTTAAAYSRGSKAAFDGSTWTADTDDDFMLQVYITTGDTSVVMPSGYTSKAHISWARNDGSGNLLEFSQHDKDYRFGINAVGTGARNYIGSVANPTLFHAAAFFPPVPMRPIIGVDASVASVGLYLCDAANHLPSEVDPLGLFTYFATQSAAYGGDRPMMNVYVGLVERQGFKCANNAGTIYLWAMGFVW